jgi:hypothetical protein
MKKFKILITFVMAALMFGCSEDDSSSLDSLTNAAAPANISALFKITQDNTGTVTIIPRGEGVVNYEVHYGHGAEEPVTLNVGGTTTHIYPEGNYTVKIIATGINGKKTEVDLPLTVSFLAPTDVVATVAGVPGNSFGVTLGATASLETFFTVDWGDGTPVEEFMEGETLTHEYAEVGTYTVTVTALSGGVATTTVTETVTVTNPLVLPVTFENTTLNYVFADFGNAVTSVVNNPDASGENTSTRVGMQVKSAGAETWAGTVLTLDGTIDFSEQNQFKVKVWSPVAGAVVKLKVENLTDGAIAHEVDAVTTVANAWEVLSYDFAGINTAQEYSKIVLFFNFGVAGTGETYYFDDIQQVAGVQALPVTFETAFEYTWNNFGGATGSEVTNPHVSGINTSATVGQVFKNAGSETWAGVAVPLQTPVDFSIQQKVKIKVWSPQAGITVLLKWEQLGAPTVNTEVSAVTTVANQWEELTFDFTGINNANNYQMMVLFFDFGNAGTGATYYFDDVKLSN